MLAEPIQLLGADCEVVCEGHFSCGGFTFLLPSTCILDSNMMVTRTASAQDLPNITADASLSGARWF